MVKEHSDTERGNPLPPLHGLLCPISNKCAFICTIPHTTAFITPIVEHWLERKIVQWVHISIATGLALWVMKTLSLLEAWAPTVLDL